MAIDKAHHQQGLGSLLIKVIIGMVWNLNRRGIACRFITVDAYDKAVNFYSKNGFKENLSYVKRDRGTLSMRLDIFKYNPPD